MDTNVMNNDLINTHAVWTEGGSTVISGTCPRCEMRVTQTFAHGFSMAEPHVCRTPTFAEMRQMIREEVRAAMAEQAK